MNLAHWIHHLLNPHCQHCIMEAEERKICQSCETLKMQLSIANHEKKEMLNSILAMTKKPEEAPAQQVDYEKLKPSLTPWRVRKQMLEAEDREKAKLLAEKKKQELENAEINYVKKSIESLEAELGVEGEVKSSA